MNNDLELVLNYINALIARVSEAQLKETTPFAYIENKAVLDVLKVVHANISELKNRPKEETKGDKQC